MNNAETLATFGTQGTRRSQIKKNPPPPKKKPTTTQKTKAITK